MSARIEIRPGLKAILATEMAEILEPVPPGTRFSVPPHEHICGSLELFIPALLRTRFPEWERESLDGIFVARATKTGPGTARFLGTCILISDQTITPLWLELSLSPAKDALSSYRVLLGEPGSGRLGISGPPCNSEAARQMLETITSRFETIRWSYSMEG